MSQIGEKFDDNETEISLRRIGVTPTRTKLDQQSPARLQWNHKALPMGVFLSGPEPQEIEPIPRSSRSSSLHSLDYVNVTMVLNGRYVGDTFPAGKDHIMSRVR